MSQCYTVTIEGCDDGEAKRVLVLAGDQYTAMAIAQQRNPGWYPVDVEVAKRV